MLVPWTIQADNGAGISQGIIGLTNKGETRTSEQWGARGTKLLRRNLGEQVENLASSGEYHWFAGNFIKYAGPLTKNDLPVDAHQLVALCVPRPIFISAGSANVEGQWVDAKGMFLGGLHAGSVYRLLGKNDIGAKEFPAQETTLTDGDIAFRQHEGGHTTGPN